MAKKKVDQGTVPRSVSTQKGVYIHDGKKVVKK